MRDQLMALAARPTKEESVDAIEAILGRIESAGPSAESILEDLDAERR